MTTFILSYDPLAANVNIMQLYAFIKENRYVEQHYTPFASVYILKSNFQLPVLRGSFSAYFQQTQFIVAPIQPPYIDGNLPQNMWSWVLSGQLPALGHGDT